MWEKQLLGRIAAVPLVVTGKKIDSHITSAASSSIRPWHRQTLASISTVLTAAHNLSASSSQAHITEQHQWVGCQSDAIEDWMQFKLPNWFTSLSSPTHSLLTAELTCMLRDQLLTRGTLAEHWLFLFFFFFLMIFVEETNLLLCRHLGWILMCVDIPPQYFRTALGKKRLRLGGLQSDVAGCNISVRRDRKCYL